MPHSRERRRKRRGQRIKTSLKALYSAEGRSGDAMLVEISYSGARLANTGFQPPRGAPVCVYVWLESQEEPFELMGRVAGLRPEGFAIEYEKPGQAVCQMVDLAAAAVGSQPESPGGVREPSPVAVARPVAAPKPRPAPLSELDLAAYELAELERHAARVNEEIAQRRRDLKRRLANEAGGNG